MKQIKLTICFLLILFLYGCNTNGKPSPSIYLNVKSDIHIQMNDNHITTETREIQLLFVNNTKQELVYCDDTIILEKKTDNGFIYIDTYGDGHAMAASLKANGTSKKTIQMKPLEVGTYRFVFLQGYSTPEGPVYISSEFQVNES